MHLSFWSLNWAFKLPVRLGAEEEAQWQVLGQGTEEARGTKSCYIHRQETQGNSWGRLKASSDIPNLLQPVVALAGLLLTEEPFDLRHPRCLAPLLPALDTAEDAEPGEEQKA